MEYKIEILNSDELSVGDFVTVIKCAEYEGHTKDDWVTGGVITTTKVEDNSYKGDVLQILAINMPFIVLKNHSDTLDGAITLDLRKWKFMRITKEFIEASLNKESV